MEIAEEMFQQQAGTKKKNIVHIHFNYDNWGAKSNQSLSTNIKDDQKNAWQVIRLMMYRTKQDI